MGNTTFADFRNILTQLKKIHILNDGSEKNQRFTRLNSGELDGVTEVIVNRPEAVDFLSIDERKNEEDIALGVEGLGRDGGEFPDSGFEEIEDFLANDVEPDDDNNTEDEDFYSRIRSNAVALMQSKTSDSILPSEVLSAFLGKLPNLDLSKKLNEEVKKPFFYELEKKKLDLDVSIEDDLSGTLALKKANFGIRNLNEPTFNQKSRIIDQFAITRKELNSPGEPSDNQFYQFTVHPFNQFKDKKTIMERSIEYGMGDFVYQNNAVNRRSDVLQTRTFGPEIRLNSTVWGYGKLDKSLTQNVNSEEDYGLLDGLGFPELVEHNAYDDTFLVTMAYGGTPFSNKFFDFV